MSAMLHTPFCKVVEYDKSSRSRYIHTNQLCYMNLIYYKQSLPYKLLLDYIFLVDWISSKLRGVSGPVDGG